MTVLIWGIMLSGAAFLIHLLVWKIRLPKRQTKVLLQIFFGTFLLGSFLLWSLEYGRISECIHIFLWGTALTLAYMITYSALEADSPSLVMITSIASEPDGLSKARFEQLMSDDILIMPRIRDLLRDQLAYQDGGYYKLTPKGRLFARIFIGHRQVMNANHKGG